MVKPSTYSEVKHLSSCRKCKIHKVAVSTGEGTPSKPCHKNYLWVNMLFNRANFKTRTSPWLLNYALVCKNPFPFKPELGYNTKKNSTLGALAMQPLAVASNYKKLKTVVQKTPITSINLAVMPNRTRKRVRGVAQLTYILRYLEHMLGSSVSLAAYTHPTSSFNDKDLALLYVLRINFGYWLLHSRIKLWHYAVSAVVFAMKWQDVSIMTLWFCRRAQTLPIFKHRAFLTNFFTLLRLTFAIAGPKYKICGISVKVAGKIGVTGNARKRRLRLKLGKTSAASLNYCASRAFNLINTSTGCLGVTVNFYYKQ